MRTPRIFTVSALVCAVSLGVFGLQSQAQQGGGAQTSIENLAPENSLFIAGAKNLQTTMDHLQRTKLWSLWQNDQLKALRADTIKQMGEQVDRFLQDIGAEEESLTPPSGAVGIALFPVMDEELGTNSLGLLAIADYGDNAERTHKLIEAALTRGERDGRLEFEQKAVLGRDVFVVDMAKLAAKAEDEGEDDEDEFDMMFPVPGAQEVLDGLDTLHYVRDGNVLLISSDLGVLTESLERVDGKGRPGVAQRDDFKAVLSGVGEQDGFAVLLTRDIMQIIGGMDPMLAAMQPSIRALVGEVRGYGLGMRLDGPKAMVEQNLFVYMPNGKRGLTALLDKPAPRVNLPAFAGQDGVSYTSFNFEFRRIAEVLRSVVASNPMLQMQAGEALNQVEPIINQLTAALGTQVHITKSATRPFTADSSQTIVAIEAKSPQEFENALAVFAGDMGLEARDFLGQRIYSMDPAMMGMMMPMGGVPPQAMSLGIGGGFVVLGTTPSVEQALRSTGQVPGGAAGLAAEKQFQRATAVLSPEPLVAWGYSDTIASMEATMVVQRESMQKTIEQMRQWDPETAQEMEESMAKQMGFLNKLDFALMRRYIGPASWQVRSTNDGFIMNVYQLAAE